MEVQNPVSNDVTVSGNVTVDNLPSSNTNKFVRSLSYSYNSSYTVPAGRYAKVTVMPSSSSIPSNCVYTVGGKNYYMNGSLAWHQFTIGPGVNISVVSNRPVGYIVAEYYI